jgi:type I restriction enzyme S subunit
MRVCDEQAAVLSKLVKSRFVEMFEPLDYSDNTLLLSDLANIASGITKGRRVQSGTPLTEVPYMAVSNVKDGYIDRTVIKTIGVTPAELDKYRLFPNDVLMTEGGDPDKLGRGALLADPPKDCIHQNHVFRVRIDSASEMLPQWFAMYLQSPYAKRYFLRCAKRTTGIATINKRQIGNLPVRLPPLSLQREFAVFAAQADKSRVVAQKQKKTLQTLYDSLAQEYFAI